MKNHNEKIAIFKETKQKKQEFLQDNLIKNKKAAQTTKNKEQELIYKKQEFQVFSMIFFSII